MDASSLPDCHPRDHVSDLDRLQTAIDVVLDAEVVVADRRRALDQSLTASRRARHQLTLARQWLAHLVETWG